ncbi:MAG: MarR family transcriptional regulator [Dehalococcoidales bacterium]|jgi:DNA-binding MarR family transcriptional regulator|nr:MarR family transcriptional regulator [Dehalococcoidales bacterium]
MDKNACTEAQFNVQLKKLNDFIADMLSDAPILVETEDNLTMSQLRVLLLLRMNTQMNMTQIASCLKIHVSTATGLVNRMINKKLIKREMSEEDRRVILCVLSDKGHNITDSIWKVVWENAHLLSAYITTEELNVIGHSLDILQKAWGKMKEKQGDTTSSELLK